MYKVAYSESTKQSLQKYIQFFEDANIQRFSDSGLWCEDIIIEWYREHVLRLFLTIHDHILNRLSDDRVFWRRPDPEDPQNFMLITPIEDRTLIIDYREDTESPIRTIIELRIFRE